MKKLYLYVTLKKDVLDPQGKAIENSLIQLGFKNINNVRQGKIIEIDLNEEKEIALEIVDDMCKKLLVNLIIEDYEIIIDKEE